MEKIGGWMIVECNVLRSPISIDDLDTSLSFIIVELTKQKSGRIQRRGG